MIIEHRDDKRGNRIVAAMILSDAVCGRIASKWVPGGLFAAREHNVVGNWCVEHYRKHGKAPNKGISSYLEDYVRTCRDKATAELIERFLVGLNEEYGKDEEVWQTNGEHEPGRVLDVAGDFFDKVKLEKLRDDITVALEAGRTSKAWERVQECRKVELGTGAGVDLFLDEEAVMAALREQKHENLIEYGHPAIDRFFRHRLIRGAFVCVLAPEKMGKCLSGDMEVPLVDGRIKTIREIVKQKIDVPILSLDERTQRFEPVQISDFWDNGKKECWRVKMKSGRREVTTSNHQYLTPDGWKNLEDLKVGEFIATPKRVGFFGTKKVNEDELKFLAYMLADGSCTNGHCSFTKTDPGILDDFFATCNRLGIQTKQDGIDYRLRGAARGLLRKWGVYGSKSKDKTIPEIVLQCCKEQVALFLRIFFSCDGHISKKSDYIELCLASKKMIKQICHLLVRFGVVHDYEFRWASCNGKRFKAWRIRILSQEYINLFLREINFTSYKQRDEVKGKSSKSFLDRFPPQIASRFMQELEKEYESKPVPKSMGTGAGKHVRPNHAFRQMFGTSKAASVREQLAKNLPIMRQSFAHVDSSSPVFQKYMNSEVLWDEVVGISSVGERHTYDLTVPDHHNFVANNCVVHNTALMIDMAVRAMEQRRKVAFFEVGDETETDLHERFLVRAVQHPFLSSTNKWPFMVKYPTSIKYSWSPDAPKDVASVETETCVFEEPLNETVAWEACKRIKMDKVKSKTSHLRTSVHPNLGVGVDGIESILDGWALDDWTPDCIFIDYPDNLQPPVGRVANERDSINKMWQMLRAMSQKRHCLLVVATQANRESYERKTIDRRHVSDDKRKLAHATFVFAINANSAEKEVGVCRLNAIVGRRGKYDTNKHVHLAGAWDIGNPAVASTFGDKPKKGKEEDE